MQVFTFSETEYKAIIDRLDFLTAKVTEKNQADRNQIIYDNENALKILKCSRRSLQKYRSEGLITYSIVNSKLYYTHENLMEFIERHQQKRFK